MARKLDVPTILLVINKVLPSLDFSSLREQVEATYNAHVAAIFPLATEMLELGSAGLFCLRHPYHPLTRELQKAAQEIMA